MKLYIIRHGLTEANEKGIINSHSEEPLSATGRSQIPSLIETLKDKQFEVIYSSPLKRAVETAEPIAKDRNLTVMTDERLTEVDFGSFTGQSTKATIPVFGQEVWEMLNSYTFDLTKFGGESGRMVEQRVRSFLDELKRQSYKSALIVTHGGVIRWIYLLCREEKVTGFPNLSVHEFII